MISILRREPTPNPNAFKFHTNTVLVREGSLSFENETEASRLPIAKALFDLGCVTSVMIADDFVSVSLAEWGEWKDVEDILTARIGAFDREEASRLAEELARRASEQRAQAKPNELLDQVNQLIDTFVRPALAGDGGGLQVLDVTSDKVVRVRYQGACGSCPSATSGTLMAIENLLRNKLDPEITLESA